MPMVFENGSSSIWPFVSENIIKCQWSQMGECFFQLGNSVLEGKISSSQWS